MPPARTDIRFTLSGPLFDNPNLGNQIVAEFLSIMHNILDGTAMPRMRNRIPVQTGNLKKSLRIAYSPAEGIITLGFTPRGFYWRFPRGLRDDLHDIAVEVVRANAQAALNLAVSRVLA